MSDKDRVVLITGGGRGLGLHLSDAFIRAGYCVVINYMTSEEGACRAVAAAPERTMAVRADVGSFRDVIAMIGSIEKRFKRLDMVINNAGMTKDSLMIKQSEDEWDSVIRTNLTGCFNVIRAAAPLMARAGGGHIINIASYSGLKGREGQAAYSASKAALIGLTRTAARELAGCGIKVNAVLPGFMFTDMASGSSGAAAKAMHNSILNMPADPASTAGTILSLSRLNYITGQTISLDSRII